MRLQRDQQRYPLESAFRRARARGAAYAEAVIVIMFMIIIFAGVQYLPRYFRAKQNALLTARQCAWIHSKNACRSGAPLPPECTPQNTSEPNDALGEAVASATNNTGPGTANASNTDPQDKQTALRGSINNQLLPMVRNVVGEGGTAVAKKPIERTRITALAPGEIEASYYLPCNLEAQKPLDVVTNIWSDLAVDIP